MGSLLSPVIASFVMEDFEEVALRTAYKAICWFSYLDDTFMIWTHGLKELKNFISQLSNIHPSIRFTMET